MGPVERTRFLPGELGLQLHFGPNELPAATLYRDGEGHLGAWDVVVVPVGAVRSAVVVHEGSRPPLRWSPSRSSSEAHRGLCRSRHRPGRSPKAGCQAWVQSWTGHVDEALTRRRCWLSGGAGSVVVLARHGVNPQDPGGSGEVHGAESGAEPALPDAPLYQWVRAERQLGKRVANATAPPRAISGPARPPARRCGSMEVASGDCCSGARGGHGRIDVGRHLPSGAILCRRASRR